MRRVLVILTVLVFAVVGYGCGGSGNYSNVSVSEVLNEIKNSVDTIIGIEIGTEENDPNNLLGKANQYIELGWFKDSRAIPEWLDPVEFETRTGGTLEKFANASDARKRHEYLQSFTGFLQNYSELHGVYVVRLSDELTASQQKELFEQIKNILDKLN